MLRFDTIIVSGGRGNRLGGVDKAMLRVGGQTMLSRTLAAVDSSRGTSVVVGPHGDLGADVLCTLEQPAGGGPVAAIAAGVAALDSEVGGARAEWTCVLACDMPGVGAGVEALRAAVEEIAAAEEPKDVDGAWLVDGEGRRQPLLAAYRSSALADALASLGRPDGASLGTLTEALRMVPVTDVALASADVDTWDDAAAFGITEEPTG